MEPKTPDAAPKLSAISPCGLPFRSVTGLSAKSRRLEVQRYPRVAVVICHRHQEPSRVQTGHCLHKTR